MVERYVSNSGTISIATGASTVTGTGTTFSGRDRAGAAIWACPSAAAPFRVGTVAEVDPRGLYDNLSLPLVTAYNGLPLANSAYELVDGPAIANGATQAAIYARFAAFLEQNAGLIFNSADNINLGLVPNGSLYIDKPTRRILEWRDGLLEAIEVIGAQFTPRGLWSGATSYAKDDLVLRNNKLFISNQDVNLNHAPPFAGAVPSADAWWTYYPLPTVQDVLDELGIHKITISTNFPSGGVDGDLWFKV